MYSSYDIYFLGEDGIFKVLLGRDNTLRRVEKSLYMLPFVTVENCRQVEVVQSQLTHFVDPSVIEELNKK